MLKISCRTKQGNHAADSDSSAERGVILFSEELKGLARIIHEGSLRKRADAKRDGHSEA